MTVEVPCEEEAPVKAELEITGLPDLSLQASQPLSPLVSSPAHTCSDLGYESLASPLSDADMDLSDFWCESLTELFPGLA